MTFYEVPYGEDTMMRWYAPLSLALCLIPTLAGAELIPPDGRTVTGTGVSFAGPGDWKLEQRPGLFRLTAPEGDVQLVLANVGSVADATAAVKAALPVVGSDFARQPSLITRQQTRQGWDEAWDFQYETAPEERRALFASAYRHGTEWIVLFGTGALNSLNKRGAAVRSLVQSLHPAVFVAETFAGRTAHPLDAARIAQMKAFVSQSMTALGIPGVALAFIQDGRIVDEGGLGVRELGRPEPVDARTRFMVASNTKGMTTLLLAKLVDDGKLAWDEAVVQAYPGFRLGDAGVTKAIKVRHLVCACTGMPRQDMEWMLTGNAATPAGHVFDLLGTMQPTSGFGKLYQYSNLLAASAGYVAARVAFPGMEVGAGYDRAMTSMIWGPLGMKDTTLDSAVALAGDHASPHADDIDGQVAVLSPTLNDSIRFLRPAGGAWSTAHDMALYALDELNAGKLPDGRQIISVANVLERRIPGVSSGDRTTYGLGLENSERYGVRVISHGGSLLGYKTNWLIIPDARVGAVILTNGDNARELVGSAFARRLLELLYDGKSEAGEQIASAAATIRAEEKEERARVVVPPDPAAEARLAARYDNVSLGHIDVRRDSEGVMFDFGGFSSHVGLRPNSGGTTSFVLTDAGLVGRPFDVRPGATFDELILRDSQHEYVYSPSAGAANPGQK